MQMPAGVDSYNPGPPGTLFGAPVLILHNEYSLASNKSWKNLASTPFKLTDGHVWPGGVAG